MFGVLWTLGTELATGISALALQPGVAMVTIVAVKFKIIATKFSADKTPNLVLGVKL